jgi:hypothetical protein
VKPFFEMWLAIREDAGFACRSLARVPTYTTTVILTLALAIGGITALFSVLYAVALRPLPFPDARELVALHAYYEHLGRQRVPSSPGEFFDIQQQNQSFSKMAALSWDNVNVSSRPRGGQAEASHVTRATVSVEFGGRDPECELSSPCLRRRTRSHRTIDRHQRHAAHDRRRTAPRL